MGKSKIEWTEETWNPSTGCNKVSAGCKFCYAEILSAELKRRGQLKYKNGFKFTIHENTLRMPYTWGEPKIVFVNSMSDLFHEDMPLAFLKRIFQVMNGTPQHVYQILTKRPENVIQHGNELNWSPNIWMGVSVENDRVLDRIDLLRTTGATKKFLSIEPLIGALPNLNLTGIDWVIVGGESGQNTRPIKPEWVTAIRDQCINEEVLFFFKQWGKAEYNPNPRDPTIKYAHQYHAKGGCMLEGKIWRQMPKRNNQEQLVEVKV